MSISGDNGIEHPLKNLSSPLIIQMVKLFLNDNDLTFDSEREGFAKYNLIIPGNNDNNTNN